MNGSKKALAAALFAAIAATGAFAGGKADAANESKPTVVKIGVVGEKNPQWDLIAKNLATQDITIQIVKFTDYTQPNQALADGELDLNAFQHYVYLKKDVEARKLNLSVIGDTVIAPLGLYSKKIKSVAELKEKDKIAVPNDATNGGRALKLLEAAGLIRIKSEAGYLPTVSDITENRLKLEIIEVDAAQTPRLLADVAASVINGGFAVDAGFVPANDAIFLEKVSKEANNPYINVIVARTADKDKALYQKVVKAYQTDEVAALIRTEFKGSYIPVWTK
jgi:D-methionine transport system substrate-binding protein